MKKTYYTSKRFYTAGLLIWLGGLLLEYPLVAQSVEPLPEIIDNRIAKEFSAEVRKLREITVTTKRSFAAHKDDINALKKAIASTSDVGRKDVLKSKMERTISSYIVDDTKFTLQKQIALKKADSLCTVLSNSLAKWQKSPSGRTSDVVHQFRDIAKSELTTLNQRGEAIEALLTYGGDLTADEKEYLTSELQTIDVQISLTSTHLITLDTLERVAPKSSIGVSHYLTYMNKVSRQLREELIRVRHKLSNLYVFASVRSSITRDKKALYALHDALQDLKGFDNTGFSSEGFIEIMRDFPQSEDILLLPNVTAPVEDRSAVDAQRTTRYLRTKER